MAPHVSLLIENIQSALGPLGVGFSFDVPAGYSALVGRNNVGKSAILQLAFRTLIDDPEFGSDAVALIPADRAVLPTTLEPGGRTLADYNASYVASLRASQLWPHDGSRGNMGELSRVLLTHADFVSQVNTVNGYLAELELPPILIKRAQQLHFDDIQAHFQGSGLRAILPTLCAASDRQLRAILIDEPEGSLEPRLQRRLRDLLVRESRGRIILVATQSHLFVNRAQPRSVYKVTKSGGSVRARSIGRPAEMQDLLFDLLGNSTEDLLLPGNFVVVEGASDETILDRVLELLGARPGQVKIISSEGLTRVGATVGATAVIEAALRPLAYGGSPYSRSVVAVIDQPQKKADVALAEEIRTALDERLVQLPAPSLEEYLPASLYLKASLDRDEVLAALAGLKKDRVALGAKKGEIARQVAAAMTEADLATIPEIAAAASLALRGSEPRRAR